MWLNHLVNTSPISSASIGNASISSAPALGVDDEPKPLTRHPATVTHPPDRGTKARGDG